MMDVNDSKLHMHSAHYSWLCLKVGCHIVQSVCSSDKLLCWCRQHYEQSSSVTL